MKLELVEKKDTETLKKRHDEIFSNINRQIKDRDELVELLEIERELTVRETG